MLPLSAPLLVFPRGLFASRLSTCIECVKTHFSQSVTSFKATKWVVEEAVQTRMHSVAQLQRYTVNLYLFSKG